MKRTLGTLLATSALLLAAACGEDTGGDDTRAEDTSASASSTPQGGDDGVAFTEVAILHDTAAGGEVSTEPVPLDDQEAVDAFVAGLDSDKLAGEVQDAVDGADPAGGQVLVGSVVSIGCDVPPGVAVQRTDSGVEITPLKVPSPQKECFAPVTTVALVTVDAGAL